MARLGVELGPRAIRGVRLEGWPRPRTQVVEVEWDRDDPTGAEKWFSGAPTVTEICRADAVTGSAGT